MSMHSRKLSREFKYFKEMAFITDTSCELINVSSDSNSKDPGKISHQFQSHLHQYELMSASSDSGSKDSEKVSQQFKDSPTFENEVCSVKKEMKTNLQVIDKSFLGINGIINLGSTCYINSIVQVFLHTPDIRNYFLTRRPECVVNNSSECLVCEMFSIFQQFYNDRTMPVALCRLLYIIWKNSRKFSGNEQQDAHEFLVNFRNIFHLHSKGSSFIDGCNCIIDLTYAGYLESTVQCNGCGRDSTNVEVFMDISLTLSDPIYEQATKKRKCLNVTSLENCLNKFIAPEFIDDRLCESCNKRESCTKFLRIKKLPRVLIFHFKRCYCNQKDNSAVNFPETIDMTPYRTKEKRVVSHGKGNPDNLGNKYKLFAVVNHKGSIAGGHFVTFIKHNSNNWFQCDDEIITSASFRKIIKHSYDAYILFYHKS